MKVLLYYYLEFWLLCERFCVTESIWNVVSFFVNMELLCFLSVEAVVIQCFLVSLYILLGAYIFTYRTLRSGVSRYLNLLSGRKSAFFTPQGRLDAPIHVPFGTTKGTGVRLATRNITPIGSRMWERGPQNIEKIPLFGRVA